MPEPVVDLPELLHVDHQQGAGRAILLRLRVLGLRQLAEAAQIVETGQVIALAEEPDRPGRPVQVTRQSAGQKRDQQGGRQFSKQPDKGRQRQPVGVLR